MKHAILVGVLICSACVSGMHANGPPVALLGDSDSQSEMALPRGLEHYLVRKLPGFSPLTSKDYDPEDLRCFDASWMLKGDFDGDDRVDACLLLKNPSERVSLVVFHKRPRGYVHFILAEDLGGLPVNTTLELAGPGRLRYTMADEPETTFVMLQNPGILEFLFETCHEMLSYWTGEEYEAVYRGL